MIELDDRSSVVVNNPEEAIRTSNMREPEISEPHRRAQLITWDKVFKVGGTTIGTLALGGAVAGKFFGPLGSVVGAIVCGIAGAAYSSHDARSRDLHK